MSVAYFQVSLSLQPKSRGEAALVPPAAIQGASYRFLIVKEGGQEGIVHVDGPDATLKHIEKDKDCKKLTAKQLDTLRSSYPKPKIKQRYRPLAIPGTNAVEAHDGTSPENAVGHRALETVQTVRSGFYLIDVPVVAESADN
jgi:hypothetical protein